MAWEPPSSPVPTVDRSQDQGPGALSWHEATRGGQAISAPSPSPELPYEDVFAVWEVIWAARHISSEHFVLFIALALVEAYREIIRDNNMDFTDIIKFFNGRRHSAVPAAAAVLLSWGFHSWPGQGKGCLRNTGPAHRGMSGVLMEIQPGGRTPLN